MRIARVILFAHALITAGRVRTVRIFAARIRRAFVNIYRGEKSTKLQHLPIIGLSVHLKGLRD